MKLSMKSLNCVQQQRVHSSCSTTSWVQTKLLRFSWQIFSKSFCCFEAEASRKKKLKCMSKFRNNKRQKQITRRRNGNTCFVALLPPLPLPLPLPLLQPLLFLVAWRGIDSYSYNRTEASLSRRTSRHRGGGQLELDICVRAIMSK